MLRIESLIAYLTSQTEALSADFAYQITNLTTRRIDPQGTSWNIDQEYQVILDLNNLHKTRTYPAVNACLKDWFKANGHNGETHKHLNTEIDLLHLKMTVTLNLIEFLQWSLLTPAETLIIPADARIFYKGTEYKQTERTEIIGL